MFTGIIEAIGVIAAIESADESSGGGWTIRIGEAEDVLVDAKLGDSIAVNGTCLTITDFDGNDLRHDGFKVGVAPETLRRTNLGRLEEGTTVNLEASCKPSTRLGGHYVQGHVDTTANIQSITKDGEALVFRFQPQDQSLLRYIVEKGYICIDGASLTVTAVGDSWLEVMLIAYTQSKVVTARKVVGDEVNVEVDMMAKYIEKGLEAYLRPRSKDSEKRTVDQSQGSAIVHGLTMLESTIERIVDRKMQQRKSDLD